MSLRGLHTFIFASEARIAHSIPMRGSFTPLPSCRLRPVPSKAISMCARSQTQRLQSCKKKERVGSTLHLHNAAWSLLVKSGYARLQLPTRGRERARLRGFHSSALWSHEPIVRPAPGTGITIHFQDSKGQPLKTIEANEGDNILDLAHEYDVDLEGACEGSVACSTCHVILTPQHYDMLPEPEDDENDMLDMAFGLTDTSRLGCQVKVTPALNGMIVKLPSATRNMFVDGVKPTKH